MKTSSRTILQIGLAITFVVIGFMILQDPVGWGALVQQWALDRMPGTLESTMRQTAYLDIVVGILFLFRKTAWIAGFLGAAHLLVVIITVGMPGGSIVIRDFGLLMACVALFVETIPAGVVNRIAFWRK